MKALHDLVAGCLNTNDWRLTLLKAWPTIFGPLSHRVVLESVSETTIVLGVFDACLMQELYLLSTLILNTINKLLGTSIQKVRFKRAEMRPHKKDRHSPETSYMLKPVTLTRAESHALATIQDHELQEQLRRYCVRCHREREL